MKEEELEVIAKKIKDGVATEDEVKNFHKGINQLLMEARDL